MTLRIQKWNDGERVVFKLTGRIQGDHLSALRALLTDEVLDQNLVLDLKEVKLVDREAVRFLAQAETNGATLRNCTAFIREWIVQERNATRRLQAERPEVQE
jgi:anti-anti-sigma regulatory factor